MAQLEEAIVARVAAIPALAALVSTRVYPLVLPQNPTLPALTYRRISTTRPTAMGRDPGIAFPRIQFTVWATGTAGGYANAKAVKDALRGDGAGSAFQRWRGTVAGVQVLDSVLANELEFYDETAKLIAEVLDFFMPYREA